MPKSSSVTDPKLFVGKLHKRTGRVVEIDACMQADFDMLDVDVCAFELSPEGKEALRLRAIAACMELRSITREAIGIYDGSSSVKCGDMFARLDKLELAMSAHINSGGG